MWEYLKMQGPIIAGIIIGCIMVFIGGAFS
jgi:hypothetical protein